jgi:hypothetical protein
MGFGRMNNCYYVYWLSDDCGVIYVGYTENPRRRLAEHRRSKDWFKDVKAVDISRYPTKEHALKEEALSILFGERLHNIQLHPRLAREAFEDARQGIHYPVIENYEDVPVGRF